MVFTFRDSDPIATHDLVYNVPIARYSEVTDVPWASLAQNGGQGTRIIVQRDETALPLDVLYIPRKHKRLIVGFHGLENRNTTSLPKFQFVNSLKNTRAESLLFLSDSTLLYAQDVSIAWMCGDESTDLASEYSQLIRSLNAATHIEETLLVGHSAGGTAAVSVGTGVPNSRAVAVNGQLCAEYFAPWTLDNLRRAVYPEYQDNTELLAARSNRLDLRERLVSRVSSSTFTWFTHIDDKASMTEHPNYPNLVKYCGLSEDGGITVDGDAIVPCRWDVGVSSPHALPGSVLPFIQLVLGETPTFAIGILGEVDPTWKRHCAPPRLSFRGCEEDASFDDLYQATIHRYENIQDVPWRSYLKTPESPVRVIVQESPYDLPLDILFVPRDARRLLVGLHGAEARDVSDLPKFQFYRSFTASRTESLLFLSDSTLLLHDRLSISWMVGEPETDLALRYASLIKSLNEALGIEDTVLVGHSAGGTAAVRIGAMIPKSHAVAINAQLSADLYHGWAVTDLRTRAFPQYDSNESMLAALSDRLDLRCALRDRAKGSRFTWYSHRGDTSSFGDNPSFPELVRHYELPEHGGITTRGDRIVMCNWETPHENKHGLPGSVLPFVQDALSEKYDFDLQIVSRSL